MSFFPNTCSKPQVVRKRYQPNLVSLMNLCATNYMLLLKVIADKASIGEQRFFYISDFLSYTVTIKEVTRYTSVVHIAQDCMISNSMTDNYFAKNKLTALLQPRMTIRLYHDARMAEVLSSQDIQQIKPRYDYPNNHMHQQDEKQQINRFLNEWLQLCLQLGHVHHNFHR